MQPLPQAPTGGPTFVRLLARLADAGPVAVGPPLAEPLSRWIDWNRAVALSTALDGRPPPPDSDVPLFDDAEDAACAAARDALRRAVVDERAAPVPADAPPEFPVFRKRYVKLQQAMQATTGRLRGELRDRLPRVSPDLARLAEVDAAMERVLGPREYTLLAKVPDVLEIHYARLRDAAPAATDPARPGPWLDAFRRDMHDAALAELDVRFLPIDALLAALRADPR